MADTDVLTDDRIDQLLNDAEARLTAKKQSAEIGNVRSVSGSAKLWSVKTTGDRSTELQAAPHTQISKREELSVRVPQARIPKKQLIAKAKADAGPGWFNMPKTDLTPELRRDLQLLRMRDVLAQGKRHYRKDHSKAVPEYCQTGTMVAGPTEYYSARRTTKQRKRTLLEEVLETEDTTRKFKSKYNEIQAASTSGRKKHYKAMTKRRYGK